MENVSKSSQTGVLLLTPAIYIYMTPKRVMPFGLRNKFPISLKGIML